MNDFQNPGDVMVATVVKGMQVKTCEQCGKEYRKANNLSLTKWKAARFCSTACWGLSKRNDPAAVLAANTTRDPITGCLVWNGKSENDGYGRFTVGKRPVAAHRAAYEIAFGPIPKGIGILHRCDNPACVEPDHLFLGTAADNAADMVSKGRQAVGEKINTAKLTPDVVREIRKSPLSNRQASRKFGVGPSQVGRIRRGESWSHIV